MRRSIPALVVLIGLFAIACGGVRPRTRGGDGARGDVKVVVLDIKHASDDVRDTVLDILAERYQVVDDSAYRHTARELDARTMKTRHVAKVTRELGLDAVAYGVLVKRGKKKFSLRMTVREGETGKKLARFTLPVQDGRIKRTKLSKRLYAALDQIAPDPEEPMPELESDGEDEPAAKKPEKARVAEKAPPKKAKPVAKPTPKQKPAARDDDDLDEESLTRAMAKKPEKKPAAAKKAEKQPEKRADARKGGRGKGDARVDEDQLDAAPLPEVAVDEDGQAIDDENPL